jgi:hypothetical protein
MSKFFLSPEKEKEEVFGYRLRLRSRSFVKN